MSIASYRRNVELGVTGPDTMTCWSASLEQLFPRGELAPEQHIEYQEMAVEYNQMSPIEQYIAIPRFEQLFNRFAGKLGRLSIENCIFRQPQNAQTFARFLNFYVVRGFRVLLELDLGDQWHAVGVKPTPYHGEYKLVSTWLTDDLIGIVTPRQLFPLLVPTNEFDVPSKYWRDESPFDSSNVLAMPPAA